MAIHIDKMNKDKVKDLLVLSKGSFVATFVKLDDFIKSYLELPGDATIDQLKTYTLANLMMLHAFLGSEIKTLTCFYDDKGSEIINDKIIKRIALSLERADKVLDLEKKANDKNKAMEQ